MTRPILAVCFALALVSPGVIAEAAGADGLPVVGVDAGPGGVASPSEPVRYVTLPAGPGTVIARVQRDGGYVVGFAFLRGRFAVPAVALDGSAAGLSRDGRTLVLIRPRHAFPRERTTLGIIDARRLRLRGVVTLRGDFSFDAIAPRGDVLYLVQYLSRRDPTRYAVRAFDVPAGRLLGEPVVDKSEPDERMRGYPITRTESPDGRWAYTLYDGAGKHPFVHALDTRERRAVCVDLHGLTGYRSLYEVRLAVTAGARRLALVDRDRPIAAVDTSSFRVAYPAAKTRGRSEEPTAKLPWLVGAGAGLAAGLLALLLWRRRLAPA